MSPVPSTFSLSQNYPNPFNPTTNVEYRIAKFGFVTLRVFDLLGRDVAILVNQYQEPGTYTVPFDSQRLSLSSGVYLYRLTVDGVSETRKLILAK
jgi:hypothetical protein